MEIVIILLVIVILILIYLLYENFVGIPSLIKNTVSPNLKIGSWTIRDLSGNLQFIHDSTKYSDKWDTMRDKGFINMDTVGNIYLGRFGSGYIADNLNGIKDGLVNGNNKKIKIGSWTIQDNNTNLQFVQDNVKYNGDWSMMKDTGFINMDAVGNIYLGRYNSGYIADNFNAVKK
jgi:hypothetical protein